MEMVTQSPESPPSTTIVLPCERPIPSCRAHNHRSIIATRSTKRAKTIESLFNRRLAGIRSRSHGNNFRSTRLPDAGRWANGRSVSRLSDRM